MKRRRRLGANRERGRVAGGETCREGRERRRKQTREKFWGRTRRRMCGERRERKRGGEKRKIRRNVTRSTKIYGRNNDRKVTKEENREKKR